jgi:hypothetical protein
MSFLIEHECEVYHVTEAAPLGAGKYDYTWHLEIYSEIPGMGCIFAPADRGIFGLYDLTEWSEDSPIQHTTGSHLLIEERNENGQAQRYIADFIESFKNRDEFERFVRDYLLGRRGSCGSVYR